MSLGLGIWKTLTEISETNTVRISNSNAVSFTESARIKAEFLHITAEPFTQHNNLYVQFVISDFRSEVDENCALLGY